MFGKNIFGQPPVDLKLLENEVHIWCASFKQLLSQVEQLTQILSEDEKNRANRFHFEQDKKRFIIGRGLLRIILGRYLESEPKRLKFAYSHTGKPALVSISSNIQFNLSHSEEMILYAFTSDRQIGIDLEYLRPILELKQLIQFFSSAETSAILSLPASEQQLAFLQTWTCKEAYLKATGEGLAQLSQVEVYIKPGEPYRLNNQPQANCWSLQTLTLSPDYVAALVVEGQNWHLKCWQWS